MVAHRERRGRRATAAALLTLFFHAVAAFSPSSPRRCASIAFIGPPRERPAAAVRCHMREKTEAAAVRRFTVGYDKLCKNCPTRLRPRVGTLAEMILGLPESDREKLLATVARRVEEMANDGVEVSAAGARTSRDVYDFQVGGSSADVAAPAQSADEGVVNGKMEKKPPKDTAKDNMFPKAEEECRGSDIEAMEEKKLASKLRKTRDKLEKNRHDLARTDRLLEMAALLLAEGADTLLPEGVSGANDCNAEIDELRLMLPEELELQRLKYAATRAKCERKMAKCRVKIFAANLEFSRFRAQKMEEAAMAAL